MVNILEVFWITTFNVKYVFKYSYVSYINFESTIIKTSVWRLFSSVKEYYHNLQIIKIFNKLEKLYYTELLSEFSVLY